MGEDRITETVTYANAPIEVEIDRELRNLLIEALFRKTFQEVGVVLFRNNILQRGDVEGLLNDAVKEAKDFLDKDKYGTANTSMLGIIKLSLSVTEETGGNQYFVISYNLTASFAMPELDPIVHSVSITRWKGEE